MRFLFALLILFAFQIAVAQLKISLNWSSDHEYAKNTEYASVRGIKSNNLYAINSSSSTTINSIDVELRVYDVDKMSLKNTLVLVNSKSNFSFEQIIRSKDKILVFTSYYDRELGFKILSVQVYDEEKNELGPAKRIDEVFATSKNDLYPFIIKVSPDGSNILLFHENKSHNGDMALNLKVIDEDFRMKWEKEITLNYKQRMIGMEDIIIDDYSTIHMLVSLNPYGVKVNSGYGALINLKSTLFTYRPYEDKLKEFEFALLKNWINSVKLVLDPHQNLIATAYYTYPNDYKIRGFVIFEIHGVDGVVLTKKMVELSKANFKELETAIGHLKEYSKLSVGTTGIYPGTSSHMNNSSTEFKLRDIYLSPFGNVMAIEALRQDERCTESFNDQQMIVHCEKHFLYGDILLVFFNKSWEIKELIRLNKLQHAQENPNPYFSFTGLAGDKGIYLVFNDDERNFLDMESAELKIVPLTNPTRGIIKISGFSYTGTMLQLGIIGNVRDQISFFPGEKEKINGSEFLIHSRTEKNYKFGRLMIQ